MQFPIQRLLNRTVWLKIHLYLALLAGFFFALIGLTGSLSVYREELDELLNPKLVIDQPSGKRQSLDSIMAAVKATHPDRLGSWTLEMPRSAHSMITAWYDKPKETFFEAYAPLMVSVNPYTAEVVASRFWGQTVTTWLLDLHSQLGVDRFGRHTVGILGLLLMLSTGSGIYLWWPSWRGILAGLAALVPDSLRINTPSLPSPTDIPAQTATSLAAKIGQKISMVRLAFELHRIIGLVCAFILLLLAFTGFNLSFPSILEALTGSSGMEHGETGRTIVSTGVPNKHSVGLEAAEFVARSSFPRAELRRVTTPTGDSGIYRINFRQSSEINQRHPYTTVWVDRWNGQIKEVRDPSGFNAGETFTTWIWPMHTGEAFGTTGKLLWFLSGIGLFVLYVTGLLRWLHRIGKVNDRELDAAALRPLLLRVRDKIYRIGLLLLQLAAVLLDKAKRYMPEIIKMCTTLLQALRSAISGQKRLEKK
jgi:uncharacterized iron-regulated membrane protein